MLRIEETPFHEAAHAAIALILGLDFQDVSIVAEAGDPETGEPPTLGRLRWRDPLVELDQPPWELIKHVSIMRLAGPLAARVASGRYENPRCQADYWYVSGLIKRIYCDPDIVEAYLAWLLTLCERLVQKHWSSIEPGLFAD